MTNDISARARLSQQCSRRSDTANLQTNSPSSQRQRPITITMFPQRTFLRASQRATQQLRSPVLRSNLQRRFASTEKLSGPADNAFNRERQAVKHHAAETSGKSGLCSEDWSNVWKGNTN
jgi:hypothetical protein